MIQNSFRNMIGSFVNRPICLMALFGGRRHNWVCSPRREWHPESHFKSWSDSRRARYLYYVHSWALRSAFPVTNKICAFQVIFCSYCTYWPFDQESQPESAFGMWFTRLLTDPMKYKLQFKQKDHDSGMDGWACIQTYSWWMTLNVQRFW